MLLVNILFMPKVTIVKIPMAITTDIRLMPAWWDGDPEGELSCLSMGKTRLCTLRLPTHDQNLSRKWDLDRSIAIDIAPVAKLAVVIKAPAVQLASAAEATKMAA